MDLKFEGKVKSTKEISTETENTDKTEGIITVETNDAEKIIIKGDVSILEGYKPGFDVIVTVKSNQQTIKESINKSRV